MKKVNMVKQEKIEIKKQLQAYGIKMGDCAKLLRISRPTLNTYIKDFETGKTIQSKRHQAIFEKLFGAEAPQDMIRFRSQLLSAHHELVKASSLSSLEDGHGEVEGVAEDLLSAEDYLDLRLTHLQEKMLYCAESRQPIPVKWVIKYNELLSRYSE